MMIQSSVVKGRIEAIPRGYHRAAPPSAVPLPIKSIPSERRRRLTHRALPALGGLAAVSMVAGAIVGSSTQSTSERVAADFAEAWERGDLHGMYDLLSESSSARYPIARFRRAYGRAAATATMTAIDAGDTEDVQDGEVTVPVVVDTRVFGSLRGELRVPVSGESVDWTPP